MVDHTSHCHNISANLSLTGWSQYKGSESTPNKIIMKTISLRSCYFFVFLGLLCTAALAFQLRQPNSFQVRQLTFTRKSVTSHLVPSSQRKPSCTHLAESPQLPTTGEPSPTGPSPTEPTGSMFRMLYTAIGSTTSMVVAGTFFVVLAYQRDAFMVSFFIGAISNGVLSKVLKRLLNQERPPELETTEMKLKPSDKGMPSSHAMSLGFIGVFTALSLPWTQIPMIFYVLISLIYRVETKLHSWDQIAVGFVIGSTNGVLWRHLVDGRNPWDIHVMDFVSQNFLNEAGVLPWSMLAVPAMIGAVVVGSFERRISAWLKEKKKEE